MKLFDKICIKHIKSDKVMQYVPDRSDATDRRNNKSRKSIVDSSNSSESYHSFEISINTDINLNNHPNDKCCNKCTIL